MEEPRKRRTRRRYTDEYKARAVRLVLKEGQAAAQVARDLGVVDSVLHRPMSSVITQNRPPMIT